MPVACLPFNSVDMFIYYVHAWVFEQD